MNSATCERIESAKQQEQADEQHRIAEDERAHRRSMEETQVLGSVIVGIAGAATKDHNQPAPAASYSAQTQPVETWQQPPQPQPEVTGHSHVSWNARGRLYGACVQVAGIRGRATVFDQSSGLAVVEELALDVNDGTPRWVGSQPRDQRTGALATAYYVPDIFVLARSSDGAWNIGVVCDLTGYCSPAQLLPVNH
jgi:hypothetical protein